MTVGAPDYGTTSGNANETQSIDVLELASRLNAIATINRTGQQVVSVNESMLYAWSMWYSSTGNAVFQPSLLMGNFNRPSLKVTTGSALYETAGLGFNYTAIPTNQIGIAGYTICGSFNCGVYANILIVKDQIAYDYRARVLLTTGEVSCLTGFNSWYTFGTYPVPNSDGEPLIFKYTLNQATHKYGKLFYGSQQMIDMSQKSCYSSAMAVPDLTLIYLLIENETAASNNIYIQDCVITINEVV